MSNCNPVCLPCENTAQLANSQLTFRTAVLDLLCEILAQSGGGLSFEDTQSIALNLTGNIVDAEALVSAQAGNRLSISTDGIYVSDAPTPLALNEQEFFVDGDWIKPANALWVEVYLVGGGSGGYKGNTQASPSGGFVDCGAGGGFASMFFRASALPPTVAVTIGQGGAGAAITGAGANGGNTTFGAYLTCFGAVTNNGGTSNSIYNINQVVSGGNSANFSVRQYNISRPGGFGGVFSGFPESPSGVAGAAFSGALTIAGGAGGAGGVTALPGGNGVTLSYLKIRQGTGGGGGGSATTGNGGRGGDGGVPGGGGGGGGLALTGNSTGNGGEGGDGYAYIRTWCSV